MISFIKKAVGFAWIAFFSSAIIASPAPWQIVPEESTLMFTGTQNNAPITGKFKTFIGEINFDPADPTASHVKILVDIASVSTSFADIAEALKTSDWFDAKLFPQAIFEAKSFTKTAENTFSANGTLTVRQQTVPVVVTFVGKELTKDKAEVKGTTVLQRSKFGIGQGEWASTSEIKDEVQVNFKLVAVKK